MTAYDVYRAGTTLPIGSVSAPPFTDTGRAPLTTYSYTVRARDAAGTCRTRRRRMSGTTLADTTEPGVPGGVTATATSAASITVSWGASTDNVAVTAYNVYRGGQLAATVNAPGLSFVDEGAFLRPPTRTPCVRRMRH